MSDATRILCQSENGRREPCGRFLGEINAGRVLIYCPACKQMHVMEIVELMRHLETYLAEVQGQAEQRRRLVGFV